MSTNLLGKQVTWTKLKGKINASMIERHGFGVLSRFEVGYAMVIYGDYGIYTTEIIAAETAPEIVGGGVIIKTKNSVYLVQESV